MWLQKKLERGNGGGGGVLTDPWDKGVSSFRWSQIQAEHVGRVPVEALQQLPTLHVPQRTGPIPAGCQDLWGGRMKSFLWTDAPSWSHDQYIKAEARGLLLVFRRRMFPETGRWNTQEKGRFLPACLSWWSYKQTGSLCAWPQTSSWQPGSRSYPATEDTRSICYPGPLKKDRKNGKKNSL